MDARGFHSGYPSKSGLSDAFLSQGSFYFFRMAIHTMIISQKENAVQVKNSQMVKNRLLELANYYKVKGLKGLAGYLGVPVTQIYGWVKNGNITDTGIFLAKCPGVNREWLKTGEGPMKPEANNPQSITLDVPGNGSTAGEKLTAAEKTELLEMTSEVLESETVYRPALVSNIRAFHRGVKGEQQMEKLEKNIELMMEIMEEMRAENRAIADRLGIIELESEKKQIGNAA